MCPFVWWWLLFPPQPQRNHFHIPPGTVHAFRLVSPILSFLRHFSLVTGSPPLLRFISPRFYRQMWSFPYLFPALIPQIAPFFPYGFLLPGPPLLKGKLFPPIPPTLLFFRLALFLSVSFSIFGYVVLLPGLSCFHTNFFCFFSLRFFIFLFVFFDLLNGFSFPSPTAHPVDRQYI